MHHGLTCHETNHQIFDEKKKQQSKYLGESKVLQYFSNMRHNLAAPDTFAEVVKVVNHSGLWDAKFVMHWNCFYGFEHGYRIHVFRYTSPCLIVEVLSIWAKFLSLPDL